MYYIEEANCCVENGEQGSIQVVLCDCSVRLSFEWQILSQTWIVVEREFFSGN